MLAATSSRLNGVRQHNFIDASHGQFSVELHQFTIHDPHTSPFDHHT